MTRRTPTLVLGLGNPGEHYARTRHNVGYMVADTLGESLSADRWTREGNSLVCRARYCESSMLLAKPLTYMNRSGEAARQLLAAYGLDHGDLLVVVDDFNLPFGRLRIRVDGSAGGHNGLESLIRTLGSTEFVRVRLGIGEDWMPADRARFVLEEFPKEREAGLMDMIMRSADAVKTIFREGVSRAMSAFNA
jgi:PTH1 family peptidyl-tRNA hydrolase